MSFNARPNKYLHPSELYKFKSLVMTMIKRVKCFFKEYMVVLVKDQINIHFTMKDLALGLYKF
jgi:hypothetical protein